MIPNLTSAQEAAFNAAAEAMHELGFYIALTRSEKWRHEGQSTYTATCQVPGVENEFCAAIADTAAEAVRDMIDKANEIIANPPPKAITTAGAAKQAAAAIVEEYRGKDVSLDEIADRIAALPVKG